MKENTKRFESASDIRMHFGSNLRRLISQSGKSHTEICKQLCIHRTQLTRFLESQSFPRPEILTGICELFDVDARILTTDLDSYSKLFTNALPADTIGQPQPASVKDFPDGFYEEWRPLLPCNSDYVCHLLYVSTRRSARITRLFTKPARTKSDGSIEYFGSTILIAGTAINQAGGLLIIDNQFGAMHYTITALKYGFHGSPEYYPGHKKSVSAIVDGRRIMKSATVLKYIGHDISAAFQCRRKSRFRTKNETPETIRVILDDMEQIYDLG